MLHSGPLSPRAVNETRLQYTRGRLGAPPNDLVGPARFASLGEAHYDGLTLSLRRRFSGAFSGRVAYTWSKAEDDAGNAFFFTPQNSADIGGEWGPSDNDQRHRLVLSGSLESPPDARGVARALRGLRLSGVFTYGSALPFNVLTGTDRNNDTSVNDRPAGVGRNSARGFGFASLDLRLSRRFTLTGRRALELIVEAFNALNHANYQLPTNVFGTGSAPRPSFGLPTQAADPRQLQLGLRFDF